VRRSFPWLRPVSAVVLLEAALLAQTPQTAVIQTPPAGPQPALRLDIPHSSNPFHAYRPTLVPQPNLANSPRIDTLVKDGVLELSLKDAIALSLENNLDIAIARYKHSDCGSRRSSHASWRIISRRKYRRGAEYAGWWRGWAWRSFEWCRRGRNVGRSGWGGFGRIGAGVVDAGHRNKCFDFRPLDLWTVE